MLPRCRVPYPQVRVAACQQLSTLARGLGEDGLRQQLLGELTQLLEDEEVQVCGWLAHHEQPTVIRPGDWRELHPCLQMASANGNHCPGDAVQEGAPRAAALRRSERRR